MTLAVEYTLIETCDALFLDLDGVVYAGSEALPGVAKALERFRVSGVRLLFVTNNAARTPAEVTDHLDRLGISVEDSNVLTSAQAAAGMIARFVPAKARVLVVGGAGLTTAIEAEGLCSVRSADDDPAAVVQGFHPDVGWRQLAEGAYAVARGLPWVASNSDCTLPTECGIAPGNGALVETIRIATGRTPRVAGKPGPGLFDEAARHSGARCPLVVGDRLDTDIAGARAAGYPSLLVLTGVTGLRRLVSAAPSERPTYVGADLQALLQVPTTPHAREGRVECGGWVAEIVGGGDETAVWLSGDGEPADGIHAAAVAVWSESEDLDVPQDAVDLSQPERRCRLG